MEFKDLWNTAAKQEPKQFATEDLPEGTYICEVLSCKLTKTKAGDKDMIAWDMRVVQGEHKNSHIWLNRPFSKTDASEQNIKAIERATGDFVLLGLSADTVSLAKTMTDIVGKHIEISLKNGTNGQFKNFKRIVDAPPADAAPAGTAPDDEGPF